ncbi:imelysin family protein [Microvirga lenta]|uniref:imelysin family protein n=1 Tax=Microvirga lenta TaxID=2881337 RepID=UPI001CFD55C2|nr:imelysin family protein [Microvirga lenta]MCB5173599.1 imelysin family protein [Microvirga lenta]
MPRLLAGIVFVLVFAFGIPASAADHRETALRAARDFVLPRYEALAAATSAQVRAWAEFCKTSPPRDPAALDAAFGAAADAWARIEFLRYGPIGAEFRFERMAHWPERRNAVSRALSGLVARPDAEVFAPERFRETSVAGQGLSALERLLFEDETRSALRSGAPPAERLCRIGQAIANALASTSRDVADEWRRDTLPALENAGEAQAREAVTRFATELMTGLQVVEELKLGGPLGRGIDAARPSLAEMWRSGRAARTIRLNLEAARALAAALLGPQADGEGRTVVDTIGGASLIAEGTPEDLGEAAADPARRSRVVLLRDAVASARAVTAAALPPILDITTGFNSLDGD